MARAARWIVSTLFALLGVGLVLAGLLLAAANTAPGRRVIESQMARLTEGEVRMTGFGGRFPDALRVGRIELHDRAGLWLAIDELRLDWAPTRLVLGIAQVDRLAAARIALDRLPAYPAGEPGEERSAFSLPVRVMLGALRVAQLDLAEPVAGIAAVLAIEGRARVDSLAQGGVDLSVRRRDAEGDYQLQGHLDADGLQAHVHAEEPVGGLLSTLAGFPELGALAIDGQLEGPLSALGTTLDLKAGPFQAGAQGTLDLDRKAADLTLAAEAPALQPRPDLAWRSVALRARVQGPFDRPAVDATLRVADLRVSDGAMGRVDAEVRGDGGSLRFHAELDGIRIPGPKPDVLRAAPLTLAGSVRLDDQDRPVEFRLCHPLVAAKGSGTAGANLGGRIDLTLPDLTPFAAAAGLDLRGSTRLALRAASENGGLRVDLSGGLAVTGGAAPFPGLLGEDAKLDLSLSAHGRELRLTRLRFDGKSLALSAAGKLPGEVADLNFKVALPDLRALAPRFSGRLEAEGKVAGPAEDLSMATDIEGEVAAENWPRGPISAALRLKGLPGSPSGTVTARGVLDRAPLELAVKLQMEGDGALRLAIDRADWKSAHAEAALRLPKHAVLPIGKLDFRVTRLADLAPLVGRPVTGSLVAAMITTERAAHLRLDARDAGLSGTATAGNAQLVATVASPLVHPVLEARLTLDAIRAGDTSGSARLEVSGPERALALRVAAELTSLGGADGRVNGTAVFDVPSGRVAVSELDATWKGERLRLLAPAHIAYRDAVRVDRLQLALGKGGVLEAAGRVTPTLDLTVAAREVSASLVGLFTPELALDGTLRASARLSGPPQRPRGSVFLAGEGLRLRSGPGRGLPPASLSADLDLQGEGANIVARIKAGSTFLNLAGSASFDPSGPLDLRAGGKMDLAALDPLLAVQGRRVRGQVSLNANLAGTVAEPRPTGTVEWANGEVQDFGQGLRLSGITAVLRAEGDTVRLARFEGRAGPGTVRAEGTMGVLAKARPIDLHLTAEHARLLSSDRLTVNLNADLTLQGLAAGSMEAAGKIRLNHAEIMIPERLPASIAVLDVRRPGEKPPPPPAPPPEITLNLEIDAPSGVFARGRGLDAELAGRIRVQGTVADPKPLGVFELRRGEFSLGGEDPDLQQGGGRLLRRQSHRPIAELRRRNDRRQRRRDSDRRRHGQPSDDQPQQCPDASPGRGAGAAPVRPRHQQSEPVRVGPDRVRGRRTDRYRTRRR